MNLDNDNDFFLQDHKDDEQKNEWILVGNVKFDPEKHTNIFGKNDKFFVGVTVDTRINVIVRQSVVNKSTEKLHTRDKNATVFFAKEGITYVLKTFTPEYKDNHIYFFYEFYEYNFRHFCEKFDKENREDVFKSILMDLLEGISLIHLQNVAINNLSSDNIAICKENGKLKPKIFDLSLAIRLGSSENAACHVAKDVKDVGVLLLMIFFEEKIVQKILDKLQQCQFFHDKVSHIFQELKIVIWIKHKNIMLLSDLIVCLIEVKPCDGLKISAFKEHSFFWNNKKICDFFQIINSRINPNVDGKNKAVIKSRIEKLNSMMPKYNWSNKLSEEVKVFTKNGEDWSELIRFIRNKSTHFDDDSGDEATKEDGKDQEQNNKSSINPKKDLVALKKLKDFFEVNNGPLNYFLSTFEDLLFNIFDHFRTFSNHPKVKEFYPQCFLYDDPNQTLDGSNRSIAESEFSITSTEQKTDITDKPGPSIRNVVNKKNPNISSQSKNDEVRKYAEKNRKIKEKNAEKKKGTKSSKVQSK